jgi:hypothetical protein
MAELQITGEALLPEWRFLALCHVLTVSLGIIVWWYQRTML